MKIALAQQNYHIGNFEENTRKIMGAIRQAKQAGADLVIFSELSVCGYPPRDFLEFEDFIAQCYASVDRIREEADTIGVIVGSPARNTAPHGKDLFNLNFLAAIQRQDMTSEIKLLIFDLGECADPRFEPAKPVRKSRLRVLVTWYF